MPKGLLQEKFQRTVKDPKTNGGNSWASFESARRTPGQETQHYTQSAERARATVGGDPRSNTDFDAPRNNRMPPGMNSDHQKPEVGYARDGGLAGSTDDESNSVTSGMLMKGFQRQNMHSADEMYTNEHVEEFYGDAEVDGKTGFLERNNYLDRN